MIEAELLLELPLSSPKPLTLISTHPLAVVQKRLCSTSSSRDSACLIVRSSRDSAGRPPCLGQRQRRERGWGDCPMIVAASFRIRQNWVADRRLGLRADRHLQSSHSRAATKPGFTSPAQQARYDDAAKS